MVQINVNKTTKVAWRMIQRPDQGSMIEKDFIAGSDEAEFTARMELIKLWLLTDPTEDQMVEEITARYWTIYGIEEPTERMIGAASSAFITANYERLVMEMKPLVRYVPERRNFFFRYEEDQLGHTRPFTRIDATRLRDQLKKADEKYWGTTSIGG